MQLELFPFEPLSIADFHAICREIRNHYWHIRNLRGGRFGQARLRYRYRKVAIHKKRLLLAGVPAREVLDLLACCRGKCSRTKQPFTPCKFCF